MLEYTQKVLKLNLKRFWLQIHGGLCFMECFLTLDTEALLVAHLYEHLEADMATDHQPQNLHEIIVNLLRERQFF